jgi:hypothetical protein
VGFEPPTQGHEIIAPDALTIAPRRRLICISYRTYEIDYCSLFIPFHTNYASAQVYDAEFIQKFLDEERKFLALAFNLVIHKQETLLNVLSPLKLK